MSQHYGPACALRKVWRASPARFVLRDATLLTRIVRMMSSCIISTNLDTRQRALELLGSATAREDASG